LFYFYLKLILIKIIKLIEVNIFNSITTYLCKMSDSKQQTVCVCKEELINEYIAQLSQQEQIVLEIAKEHLESSFDIKKSIGFMEWINKRDK